MRPVPPEQEAIALAVHEVQQKLDALDVRFCVIVTEPKPEGMGSYATNMEPQEFHAQASTVLASMEAAKKHKAELN